MTTKLIGGKDRSDYRSMATRELIEEAVYRPNIELCIALGERLEEYRHRLDGMRYDVAAERAGWEG